MHEMDTMFRDFLVMSFTPLLDQFETVWRVATTRVPRGSATVATLLKRIVYGGRKGRNAARRLVRLTGIR